MLVNKTVFYFTHFPGIQIMSVWRHIILDRQLCFLYLPRKLRYIKNKCVFMHNACNFCPISTKVEIVPQFLVKIIGVNVYDNLSNWSLVLPSVQTDMATLIVAFCKCLRMRQKWETWNKLNINIKGLAFLIDSWCNNDDNIYFYSSV